MEVALHTVAAAVHEAQDLIRGLVDGDGVERFVLGRLLLALRAPLAEAAAARPRQDAAELLRAQEGVFYLIVFAVPRWGQDLYADVRRHVAAAACVGLCLGDPDDQVCDSAHGSL